MILETGLSPRKGVPGGCPSCGGPEVTVRFDWKLACEVPESEFAHYTRTLLEQRPLRSGSLYKCSSCGQKWWLSPGQETMTLVPRDRLMLLEQWNSLNLKLSPERMTEARTIGATPSHSLSKQTSYAEVPCKVMTLSGQVLDRCLVVLRSHPPLEPFTQPPRFVTEVARILPSDAALPLAVRIQCGLSQPNRKGRAPTLVLGPKGKTLVLDWVVNFVQQDGLQGRDLTLAPKKTKKPKGAPPPIQEPEDLTIFLADWDQGVLGGPSDVLKSRP